MTDRTHWDGCWRDPGHHECAVARVERATREATELTNSTFGHFRYEAEDDEGRRALRAVAAGVGDGGAEAIARLTEHPLFDLARYRRGPTRRENLSDLGEWETRCRGVPRPLRLLAAPVTEGPDRLLGCLFLVRSAGARYSRRDERLAAGIISWAGVGIGNARLFHERDRAVAFRDRVLASVSHDLRTPLGVIAAMGELLPGIRDPDQMREFSERIQRSCGRMERLISDLLDLASIEAGHLRLEPVSTRLDVLAREALESVRTAANGKDVRLGLEAQGEIPPVRVDPIRIVQVLENLLGNAVKFTPNGGEVRLVVREQEGSLRVAVCDNGPGIAERDLQRLFDRFYRSSGNSNGGFGLGLAICKGIVDAHGGALEVESREGEGSVFTVVFELEPAGAR